MSGNNDVHGLRRMRSCSGGLRNNASKRHILPFFAAAAATLVCGLALTGCAGSDATVGESWPLPGEPTSSYSDKQLGDILTACAGEESDDATRLYLMGEASTWTYGQRVAEFSGRVESDEAAKATFECLTDGLGMSQEARQELLDRAAGFKQSSGVRPSAWSNVGLSAWNGGDGTLHLSVIWYAPEGAYDESRAAE